MATFTSAIPYIKKAEGGLSRATTDSASHDPAPWAYGGKTGWHTNKGITYTTFKGMASAVGYEVNATNFFTMPDWIWLGIYKQGYWMPILADKLKSQAIANAYVDYAWGFGVGGATTRVKKWLKAKYNKTVTTNQGIVDTFNLLTKNGDEQVFKDFIEHRKQAFIALNQPANQPGWLSRMDALMKANLPLLTKGGIGLATLVAGFFLFGL